MNPVSVVTSAAASGGGLVLQGATHAISAVRRAPKPLHPRGTVWRAEVTRSGGGSPTGVAWLDEPGHDTAIVRVSAAIGLPHGWPDIQGIAMRLPDRGGADLLFASTGSGRLSRFALRLVRPTTRHVASTLVPYRGPYGPVMLAAARVESGRFGLLRAEGGGPWVRFGSVELVEKLEQELSFDPVARPIPGLENYDWVVRLRSPAYGAARRDRGETLGGGGTGT